MIEALHQPITKEEVVDAVKSLQNLKAPGEDGLPTEVWKVGGGSLSTTLRKFSTWG